METLHNNFGEHFTIDGYGGNFEKLNDCNLVLTCLNELPSLIQMTKLSDPQVYFAPGNDEKDPGGWSGFVIIAESHISIHTFPRRKFVSVDIYTCKNGLNTTFISEYFLEKFELSDIETNFLKRGTRYPVEDLS
jgi:S-adenosylmethionine decarboxylase